MWPTDARGLGANIHPAVDASPASRVASLFGCGSFATTVGWAAAALMSVTAGSAAAETAAGTSPSTSQSHAASVTAQSACAAVAGKQVDGVALAATMVEADKDIPAHCRVTGTLSPALNFEIRLPTAWNGKLYYGGGAGFDGTVPPAIAAPLDGGYAEVASDSGHRGDQLSAAFIVEDPRAAQLFGSGSVPAVMAEVRQVLAAVYGAPPARSYFEGCSTGGREALMAVQRDPDLFDGVIARAPAYNWVGLIGQFHRVAESLAVPGAAFTAAKAALLARRVRDRCDRLDGVADGVVANPKACTMQVVDLSTLRCAGGKDTGDDCLSDPQIAFTDTWTSGATYEGAVPYHGDGYDLTGNEDEKLNIVPWATGGGEVKKAAQYKFQDSTIKSYLAHDPDADSLAYEPYDRDPKALDGMAALNDATQADIGPFLRHGGKLILWHGGADTGLSVNATIRYAAEMTKAVGAEAADTSTRFYVPPGVDHCGGGVGPDSTDLLAALDRWVTLGQAPETLTAAKRDAGGTVTREMPLCRFPQYPRYTGPADDASAVKLATSYTCTTP